MTDKELSNGNTAVTVNDCNVLHGETKSQIRTLKWFLVALVSLNVIGGFIQYGAWTKASVVEAQTNERKQGTDKRLERIELQLDRIEQKLSK